MCGIWAIFGSGGNVLAESVYAANIAHRGPDASRVETIPEYRNCCLAFHHLAIVDPEHGMQPMRIKLLPHIWLVYNGEIYNYKKIQKEYGFEMYTNSDGESIIHLYNKFGIGKAAAMLDGVFAFCMLDTKAGKRVRDLPGRPAALKAVATIVIYKMHLPWMMEHIYIGRDSFGVKPLYYLHRTDGLFAICSERKGLTDFLSHSKDSTIEHCVPGYHHEYNITPDTGKVSLVGSYQHHDFANLPEWRHIVDNIHPNETDDIYTNIKRLVTEAVKKRLLSNRRMGCLVSGGLDSSLVAALTVKLAKESGNISYPIQTFCIGTSDSPDILAARKVAKHIGTEHHEVMFSPEEGIAALDDVIKSLENYDVITIRSSVVNYLLSQYITDYTDTVVIMSGEGIDELAQGYAYFHHAPSAEDADAESRRLLKDIHEFDVLRTDRCTAAHGLELRVPFLDHYFTSYYLTIPPAMRQPRDHVEKYLIRRAFQGSGLIPDEILWRQKEGFSDGVASPKKPWFKYLLEYIEDKVSDSAFRDAPNRFPYNTPKTKEAYYYRQIFDKYYPDQDSWTPYMWMPKWVDNVTNPSNRYYQSSLANGLRTDT